MKLNDYLTQVKERCEKATEGPWKSEIHPVGFDLVNMALRTHDGIWLAGREHADQGDDENFDFIAHSRTDIPTLLRVIEKLREQRDSRYPTNADGTYYREKEDAELEKLLGATDGKT